MNNYILVCDDDKSLNLQLKKDLEKMIPNCKVIQTYNKNEAIEALQKYFFTVAIVDLNLEGPLPLDWSHTGGIAVIQEVRKKDFGTKVIVVSANPEPELAFSISKDHGIDHYIQKGKNINTFSHLVDLIQDLHKSTNPRIPEPFLKTFLGLGGVEKEILESNIINILGVHGGMRTLENVASYVLEAVYPWELRSNTLYLDRDSACLSGVFWSYKSAKVMGVIVHGSNVAVIGSNIFTNIVKINDTRTISNLSVTLYDLDI